jgi:hypothetical protein
MFQNLLNQFESLDVKSVKLSDLIINFTENVFHNKEVIVKKNGKKYIYFDNIKKFPERILKSMPKTYSVIEVFEGKKTVYIRVPQQSLGFIILFATDLFDLNQIDLIASVYCMDERPMQTDYVKGTEQLKIPLQPQRISDFSIGPFSKGLASNSSIREHLSKKYGVNCRKKCFGYK